MDMAKHLETVIKTLNVPRELITRENGKTEKSMAMVLNNLKMDMIKFLFEEGFLKMANSSTLKLIKKQV